MFAEQLSMRIGLRCQVVTASTTASGVLLAVTREGVVVRTTSYPGYGGEEDVSAPLVNIGYVRFFE